MIQIAKKLLCGLILCGLPGYFSLQAQSVSRQFPAEEGGKLVLTASIGASVEITGSDEPLIHITVSADEETSDFDLRFIRQNNGLRIEAEQDESRNPFQGDVSMLIRIPRRYNLDISTLGGDIYLADIEGDISGRTMGGDLELKRLRGYLKMSTMGGDVSVENSELDGSVQTMGGDVLLRNVEGDLRGKTMGGETIYENDRTDSDRNNTKKNRSGGPIQIDKMGGDIYLENAPQGARLKTMGGNITLGESGGRVEAETYGGDIRLGLVEGEVQAITYGGDIEVTVVESAEGKEQEVKLTSYSGDIILEVPRGMEMDIDIELAYTRNSAQRYRIESDVEVKLSKSDEWDDSDGSPRKYLYARGRTGSGKHKIIISTVNGNVILKAE